MEKQIEFNHSPVMLNECIEGLKIEPSGIYVDGTMGGAGHSNYIVSKLSKDGKLIGIDRDITAINVSKQRLKGFENVIYFLIFLSFVLLIFFFCILFFLL